jgi:hypothetical protein
MPSFFGDTPESKALDKLIAENLHFDPPSPPLTVPAKTPKKAPRKQAGPAPMARGTKKAERPDFFERSARITVGGKPAAQNAAG